MATQIERIKDTDVLVVGGGLAGIVSALEAVEQGVSVTLVVAKNLCSGSSFYPFMEALACQCTLEDDVDLENFVQEMNESGEGMNDENLCRIYARNIRNAVKQMPKRGIQYKKMNSRKLACFAKTYRDIFYWEDWSTIRQNVYDLLKQKNVHLIEYTSVISIMKKDNKIAGALVCNIKNKLGFIRAKSIIMATGGYGNLYEHNLNTSDVSGEGHVLALNTGAKLINIEYLQFIPGFIKPLYKVVFREGSIVYCGEIVDEQGAPIIQKYFLDQVDVRKCIEDRALHGPFTSARISKYFDISMMKEIQDQKKTEGIKLTYKDEILNDNRENIKLYVDWLKQEKGLSITENDIYIAPFCHASNGGIWINENCETGVDGLFAAGEAAGGIHGADRHGGNASGSCLVFGQIAAISAVKYAMKNRHREVSNEDVIALFEDKITQFNGSGVSAKEVIKQVKKVMWRYGNIMREEEGLKSGLECILDLKEKYNIQKEISDSKDINKAIRAGSFIELAEALLSVMRERKESRGSHYREDYPEMNNSDYGKRIVVTKNGNDKLNMDFA